MAYVLSLAPHSPFRRSFSDNPYARSASPFSDNSSTGTVQRRTSRNVSVVSFMPSQASSLGTPPRQDENRLPRTSSRSTIAIVATEKSFEKPPAKPHRYQRRISLGILGKTGVTTIYTPPAGPSGDTNLPEQCVVPVVPLDSVKEPKTEELRSPDYAPVGITSEEVISKPLPEEHDTEFNHDKSVAIGKEESRPFRRWMSTLRRRNLLKGRDSGTQEQTNGTGTSLEASYKDPETTHILSPPLKRRSTSSSYDFVTAVKSATITLASTSRAHGLRRNGPLGRFKATDPSSPFSPSESRKSSDSNAPSLGLVMDQSAWMRSIRRRRTLEEIVNTEEGYLADMKQLLDIYFTLLASPPSAPRQNLDAVRQNITQIIQLHEDILGELYSVIPNAEYNESEAAFPPSTARPRHQRWHSVDVPSRVGSTRQYRKYSTRLRRSLDTERPADSVPVGLTADTATASKVAGVFHNVLNRFFIYEEYASRYDSMLLDLSLTQKTMQGWCEYERGIECLSSSLTPLNQRTNTQAKALTFADLLIKPIQRVLRYPILLKQLMRYTPICDDPEVFSELERILYRLERVAASVDKAKSDPEVLASVERSCTMKRRLVFAEVKTHADILKISGLVSLCGVLFVAYQTESSVKGEYLISILYRSCLILAIPGRASANYIPVAILSLAGSSIESSDNGRGLQCHTAPFAWKVTFPSGKRMFEVIFCACSNKEEEVWKQRLRAMTATEPQSWLGRNYTCPDLLPPDIKPLSRSFGSDEGVLRRLSFRRALTLGPKTHLSQVIIKNTQAMEDTHAASMSDPVSVTRSQSVLSPHNVPVLAPRRTERARMEETIFDVWSKDVLPFPGMLPSRRTENHIRASASSVMRKLSMASIASNFSKRSISHTSLNNARQEETQARGRKVSHSSNRRDGPESTSRAEQPLVDFHNAPAAFLPEDFELRPPRNARGRRQTNQTDITERDRAAVPASLCISNEERVQRWRSVRGKGATKTTCYPVVPPIQTKPESLPPSPVEFTKAVLPEQTTVLMSQENLSMTPSSKKSFKTRTKLFKFWGVN